MAKRRVFVGAILFLTTTALLPHRICRQGASSWIAEDSSHPLALARRVARWVQSDLDTKNFATGSTLFDGEWLFGTHQMAALGLIQTIQSHPDAASELRPIVDLCIDRMISPELRAFDSHSWSEDPMDGLEGNKHHAAYYGYLNFVLGRYRVLAPDNRFSALNDAITRGLIRRIEGSRTSLLETYPGEVYPVDNASVAGSIGLTYLGTGAPRPPVLDRWLKMFREQDVEASSGLVHQSVSALDGRPLEPGRGSGTALSVYFLADLDPALAGDLYQSILSSLRETVLGFGAIREYRRGVEGRGDIDSGPLILGYSISATGFSIGASRLMGDDETFEDLFATYRLFGIPHMMNGELSHITGGPIGDSIMFAMLTARRSRP